MVSSEALRLLPNLISQKIGENVNPCPDLSVSYASQGAEVRQLAMEQIGVPTVMSLLLEQVNEGADVLANEIKARLDLLSGRHDQKYSLVFHNGTAVVQVDDGTPVFAIDVKELSLTPPSMNLIFVQLFPEVSSSEKLGCWYSKRLNLTGQTVDAVIDFLFKAPLWPLNREKPFDNNPLYPHFQEIFK